MKPDENGKLPDRIAVKQSGRWSVYDAHWDGHEASNRRCVRPFLVGDDGLTDPEERIAELEAELEKERKRSHYWRHHAEVSGWWNHSVEESRQWLEDNGYEGPPGETKPEPKLPEGDG